MLSWHELYIYFLNYPMLVWSITPFRYATIVMFVCLFVLLAINYKRERSQNYVLSDFYYHPAWSAYGVYGIISMMHGVFIAKDVRLATNEGYWGTLAPLCGGLAIIVAIFLERLGHNLICWHLGTPLWPWNPFAGKPGLDKIVARNQRENRKAWAIAKRKKREQGKRFSDE